MLHTVTILLSTFSKHFEYSDINENSKRFRDWLVID